MKQKVMKSV